MLRGVVGEEVFFDGLLDYSQHPDLMYANATTEDLQEVYEEASGMDLEFFFDQWIYDEYFPAYEYNYVQNEDHSINFTIDQTQGDIGRRPIFEMPVQIKFNYTGGGDTTLTLWNDEQTQYYYLEFPQEVNSVDFDPDKWILRTESYNSGLPVGINSNQDDNRISIFPNPNNGKFMLNLKSEIESEINVRSINGKLIQTITPSVEKQQIDLSHLTEGIYFLSIENEGDTYVKKIVIAK